MDIIDIDITSLVRYSQIVCVISSIVRKADCSTLRRYACLALNIISIDQAADRRSVVELILAVAIGDSICSRCYRQGRFPDIYIRRDRLYYIVVRECCFADFGRDRMLSCIVRMDIIDIDITSLVRYSQIVTLLPSPIDKL